MTIQEYIQQQLAHYRERVQSYEALLENTPEEVTSLESDSIQIYGGWLILSDASHKELGAQLATITDQSPSFRVGGTLRTAIFRDVGPFYKVDLDRPNPKCRKVRVLRPAEELEKEICGDIPEGYTLLEELDGA